MKKKKEEIFQNVEKNGKKKGGKEEEKKKIVIKIENGIKPTVLRKHRSPGQAAPREAGAGAAADASAPGIAAEPLDAEKIIRI